MGSPVYLGQIVDVGSLQQEKAGDVFVAVVRRDVERSKTTFRRHIGVVIILRSQQSIETFIHHN